MSSVFLSRDLDTVAIYWRIERRDGVALGFVSHDRDLAFDGLVHRAAPGMVPSAIARSSGLDDEGVSVAGVLSHDAITQADLATGRYDGAFVEVGAVNWESLERLSLFAGELAATSERAGGFEAELRSAKSRLMQDTAPRTSPACRARFCGPGCGLNPAAFTHMVRVAGYDALTGAIALTGGPPPEALRHGTWRWLDGPEAGRSSAVLDADGAGVVLAGPNAAPPLAGARALVREGCDHTLQTCHGRFANARNFRGEPFLPGNDLIARYPVAGG